MSADDWTAVGVGVGFVAMIWWLGRQAGEALGEGLDSVSRAVNPTGPENLAYRAANAVGDVLNDGEDDGDFQLGAWIYDITHPND